MLYRRVRDVFTIIGLAMTYEQYYAYKTDQIRRIDELRRATVAAAEQNHAIEATMSSEQGRLIENINNIGQGFRGREVEKLNSLHVLEGQKAGCNAVLADSSSTPEQIQFAEAKIKIINEMIEKENFTLNNEKLELFDKVLRLIEESWRRGNGNNFMDDSLEILSQWKEFLLTLDDNQLCSLFSIIAGITILLNLISIIVIYNGNFLINFLKLEERYPKLATIIKIRHKVTNISLFYSFTIIFVSLFLLISINVNHLFF